MIEITEDLAKRGGYCPNCGEWFRPNGVGPTDIKELATVLNQLPSSSVLKYGSNFHDWYYHIGIAWGTRDEADLEMFLKNEYIINKKCNWWFTRWYYRSANQRNYLFVREFGWKFWNKNGCKKKLTS
jgi:hypothetical protein